MTWAAIIGAVTGLTFALFVLVYIPMSENYRKCGTVTVCPEGSP